MKFEFLKNNPKGPYEGIALSDWTDWRWQLKNSLRTLSAFQKVYELSAEEERGFESSAGIFQIRSTPYYATLGSKTNPQDPIRLIQTPDYKETSVRFQDMLDPLGEESNSVNPRLVHRYPDRVLFLVTDFCSVYCRFCTRKRFTGSNQSFLNEDEYTKALDYIKSHTGIREVILSGGDPLTVSDDIIEDILKDLRRINHIEIIRIGSRMPVVNPYRVTDTLVQIFRKYKPIFFMTHFNHPKELTAESAEAVEKIVDNGTPVMNQMVLLNGINNHPAIIQALSRRLLSLRAKPYYMFQCDPSKGTDHLRTSIQDSLEIQRELWGNISGLAMPNFSIDIPHGGGKTAMVPNFLVERKGDVWNFKGFDGVHAEYIDPDTSVIRKPMDIDDYLEEWNSLKDAKNLNSL